MMGFTGPPLCVYRKALGTPKPSNIILEALNCYNGVLKLVSHKY